jgi:hypothetical protein
VRLNIYGTGLNSNKTLFVELVEIVGKIFFVELV